MAEERRNARQQARVNERRRQRAEAQEAKQQEKIQHIKDRKLNIFDDDEEADLLQNNQTAFPQWSWDRVRPWVILRRDNDYDDEQIRQIAGHDVFVIEKMTGWKTHGNNEAGSLAAARRVKKINPKIKTLFYLNAMIHYPGYAANKSYLKDEWAMRTHQGDIFMFKNRYLWYNHSNLDFREWWITRALVMVAHDEIDGIFIDAIMKTSISHFNCPDNASSYFETAMELRRRLPTGKLLIGNALRPKTHCRIGGYGNIRHLQYLDGSYLEGWSGDEHAVAEALELMDAASKAGRMVLLLGTPTFQSGEEKTALDDMNSIEDRYTFMNSRIDFSLAIFLLVVEPYAYFAYHHGVDAKPSGRKGRAAFDCNRYEEVTRKLGEPRGGYERDGEFGFRREFEHLSVRVDVKSREAKLTVRELAHEEL